MNQTAVSLQSGSGQDFSQVGKVGDIYWGVVCDGHGSDRCIHQIRNMDMNEFAVAPNPILAMSEKLYGDTYYSGSTACFVRRQGNKIEIFNAGDSSAILYVNGDMVTKTTGHTFLNPKEVERTKPFIRRIKDVKGPFPISDERVENIPSPAGVFINGEELVPSMALGHNNITGLDPEYIEWNVSEFDVVRIVIMSDGVSDMLVTTETGTANEIVDLAHSRWKQQWKYKYMHAGREYDGLTTYGDQIDDMSCVVMEDRVKERPSLCIPYSPKVFQVSHVQECMEAFLGGVRKVEVVEHDTHNVFFVHFNPKVLDDDNKKVFKAVLSGENTKIAYNDSWWWPIKLMHGSQPLQGVTFIYELWDKVSDYNEFKDSYIYDKEASKMIEFLQNFR